MDDGLIEAAKVFIPLLVGVLTILGIVFGWFQKLLQWIRRIRAKKTGSPGQLQIPDRTLVLHPHGHRPFWWHMGKSGSGPAMQIVGALTVTNISTYGIYAVDVRMRKPKTRGSAIVRAPDSNIYGRDHVIESRAISDLRFDFWIAPPIKKPNESFTADIAIIDQFGNEHWVNGVTFEYR